MKKTLLVTGGTGFLGRYLALALKDSYRVILTGRNNKQNVYSANFTGCDVVPMDVCRYESVRDVFGEFRPAVVIHAAATKFVDLAERHPMECVDVNVIGSQNCARAAIEFETEAVIGISTDKAAPPVRNSYGMSKALMERVFCSMDNKTRTRFACVRYGNVAWSTGSVLPTWKRMQRETGVIGTTGPAMRRFFFTVDEAVRLVLTCLSNIEQVRGRVLSRKMKAAQVGDLLQEWVSVRGGIFEQIPGRPGERDDEYLVGEIELPFTSEVVYEGITHYVIAFNEKSTSPISVGLSSANAERLSGEEMRQIILNPPIEEL